MAWSSAFLALLMAALPLQAWASCCCAPGACGSETQSCCAGRSQAGPKTKSCCSQQSENSQATTNTGCCCTDPTRSLGCEQHGADKNLEGCSCSPDTANDPPLQPAPKSFSLDLELVTLSVAAFILPPADPQLASLAQTNSRLHFSPVPLRELYCIWRT